MTLGLVLRVFVTAANVGEREGGNRYSNESTRWVHQSLVCTRFGSMVVDGAIHAVGDGRLPLDCSGGVTTKANQRICS